MYILGIIELCKYVVQYADDSMIIEGSLNPRMAFRRTEKICEGTRKYLANLASIKKSVKCSGDTLVINSNHYPKKMN